MQAFLLASGCSRTVNALSWDGAAIDAPSIPDVVPIVPDTADASEAATLGCPVQPGGPGGLEPLPTPVQVNLQHSELTAIVHLGLETFDGSEQGNPSKDTPALFNPTDLDAAQWVNALKSAGFQQIVLTVKHGTGFCLWPSEYTDYSVKNSPWRNGQGDVVREFTDAVHVAGLRIAFNLTPRDAHYPSSSASYGMYFRSQLIELLSNYGPIDELWLDGFQAPTAPDWGSIAQLAKGRQPNMLVWMGPEIAASGADVRWIGNQTGQGSRTTSSVADVPNGGPAGVWYPAEAPVSTRQSWFWHPTDALVSLDTLQTTYFNTVGMNATLRLSVAPSSTGQLESADLDLLSQFGAWRNSLFATNLIQGQVATADSTWAGSGFEATRALDNDVCTYWAAAKGRRSGRIEVTPSVPVTFKVISIREPIELGERITAYHIEIKQNGAWNTVPTDAAGDEIQGTVVGQRQLWLLNATTADAVALVIDSAKAVPAIAEFGLY